MKKNFQKNFKVGDKVKIIVEPGFSTGGRKNSEAEIVDCTVNNINFLAVLDKFGTRWHFRDGEIELLAENN